MTQPISSTTQTVELARLLIQRLERLSPDSGWARRISGVRGALLKAIEQVETEADPDAQEQSRLRLAYLVGWGFDLLHKAAREIEAEELGE